MNECIDFFESYEKVKKINEKFPKKGNKLYNDVIQYFNEYMKMTDPTVKSAYRKNWQEKYDSYKKTSKTWSTDSNYKKARELLAKIKPQYVSYITQPDLTWTNEEMYANYLIPIVSTYYKQLNNGKDYSMTGQEKDSTLFDQILAKVEEKEQDEETWGKSDVEATFESYKSTNQIDSTLTYKQLKDKYKTPEKARIAIEIDKYRKLIKNRFSIFDEDLPGDTRFTGYHETALDSEERLAWCRKFYSQITQNYAQSWNSPAFNEIWHKYRYYHNDDEQTSSIEKTAALYNFDYNKGKTDLNYKYHLDLYNDTFKKNILLKQRRINIFH